MELKNKKVTVLGMGISGVYSARLLSELGAKVLISDIKKKEDFEKELAMVPAGVQAEFGGHTGKVLESDLIVISPGIPPDIPALKDAVSRKIPVIGEVELASWYIRAPVTAVTGSNGKTTTTTLIGEMLKAEGKKVVVGGNIGEPLTRFCGPVYGGPDPDAVVAEISSFQLETTVRFRPRVAVLLNITENHLDRYPGMPGYIKAKSRIFMNQEAGDYAVLNGDCPRVMSMAPSVRSKHIVFTRSREPETGVFERAGRIISRIGAENDICGVSELKLIGLHNLENALAAAAAALVSGAKPEAISKTLKEFRGLEHRIEFVREVKGVTYINDSKGTTVDAVLRAVESLGRKGEQSLVLIAGGKYKGGDFGVLRELLDEKARAVLLLGEAKGIIGKMFSGYSSALDSRIFEVPDLRGAVAKAEGIAKPGDFVVLSPGCSSFDMFRDYKERGRIFKDEVLKIK